MTMTLAQIKSDFAPYVNKYGFTTCGGDTQHQPLFHGFYLLALEKYRLLDKKEELNQKVLFETLIHPDWPGVLLPQPYKKLHRNPNWWSHDTHKAMLWASKRFGMTFAKDFLAHGRTFNWDWNPVRPGTTSPKMRGRYDRFPSMIAQAQIAAGESPTFFNKTWLYAEHFFPAGRHRRLEKFFLQVFIMRTLEGYSPIGDLVVQRWRSVKKKAYPGGLGEVLTKYGKWWKESPFIDHCWGIF